MIRGGLDSLDGFLHGADTPIVEFAAGILPALDLGVEAGNQLSQRWDLRLGGGSVAGDHFHDLARPVFAAVPALGFRQTDRRRNPFFKIYLVSAFKPAMRITLLNMVSAGLGLSTAARMTGAAMTSSSLSWFWKQCSSVARAMPSGLVDTADGLVAQLGIHFVEFLPQGAGKHGGGQLAVRDLHGVFPTDRPRGFRRRHERLELRAA